MATPSATVNAALRSVPRRERPRLYALVPDVAEYVRSMDTTAGTAGQALGLLRRSSPATVLRLALFGTTHARRVLSKEFAGLVAVLIEVELSGVRRSRPEGIVLAAALTDLALAAGNRGFFDFYVGDVRRRHGALACLETRNLGHLLARLGEWGIEADYVFGPLNSLGYLTKPSLDRCVAEVAEGGTRLIAQETTAGRTLPLGPALDYVLSAGAAGAVIDMAEMEDPMELGRLRPVTGGDASVDQRPTNEPQPRVSEST